MSTDAPRASTAVDPTAARPATNEPALTREPSCRDVPLVAEILLPPPALAPEVRGPREAGSIAWAE